MSSFPYHSEHSYLPGNVPHSSHPPHKHNNPHFQTTQSNNIFPPPASGRPEHSETLSMSSYSRAPIDYPAEPSFVSPSLSHPPIHKSHQDLLPHENNNAQFTPQQNKNNFPLGPTSTPEQETFHQQRIMNPSFYPSAVDHPTTIEAHPIPSAHLPKATANSPNYLNVVPLPNPNSSHDKPSVKRESPIPPAIPPSVPPSVSLHKNKLKSPESIGCICYDYQVLRAITHNFDDTKYSLGGYLLGEGGFGPVYLGFLCSTSVAIKVLQNPSAGRQVYKGDEQFITEIRSLTRYRHVNLLTLMGYSDDGPSRCIVYEFMCNGTLEDWLEGKKWPLHWTSRHSILQDTARGLLYLHQADPDHPLIHRDVKTANVLLDSSMQAKVGDFGLARQTDINIENKTGTILGTSGYIPPEYYAGKISIKTDVYAFGVVVLEVLTGLASFDGRREPKELVSRMRRTIEKGHKEMLRWVDKNAGDWQSGAYFEMSKLAWDCLSNSPIHRPNMEKVLQSMQNIQQDHQISKFSTPAYN